MATNAELKAENEQLREQLEQARKGEGVPTLTRLAHQGIDPSNTYEHGVSGNVNRAVPEGADIKLGLDAEEAGYIGYAPGSGAERDMSAGAAGKRNARLREQRRAAVNGSKPSEAEAEAQGSQPSEDNDQS